METMMGQQPETTKNLWGRSMTPGPGEALLHGAGPLTSSKSEGPRGAPLGGVIGSFIGMGIVGFCFGIGLMLAVKTVNNLECCMSIKCL